MEGHPDIRITTVRHEREPPAEVATDFELQGLVSRQASPPTIRPSIPTDACCARPQQAQEH